MNLYKKCVQFARPLLPGDIEKRNSLVEVKNSGSTLPTPVKLDEFTKEFVCNNVYYISDIHLVHHVEQEFRIGAFNGQVKSYIKRVRDSLFSGEFLADIKCGKHLIVLFGGDISSLYEVSELFYTEFVDRWNIIDSQSKQILRRERNIYAILGNHELWDFPNLETCCSAYQNLFNRLNIHFLNNEITWFGHHNEPVKAIPSTTKSRRCISDTIHSTLIVGGIGFAGHNQEFNANQGIYRTALNRQQEIEQTDKWVETYNRALTMAKKTGSILIVLTHTPFTDWKVGKTADTNCTYFSGHTHRNYVFHEEETGTHIFSDNQIGYKNRKIVFKKALLYNRSNPFAGFTDGYYRISSTDYLKFYDYMNETIAGNGQVERQMKTNNAQFFMIKHDGYYGFFLISEKASYICAGGRIKKIGEYIDIREFDGAFTAMVNKYLQILSPYRKVQEQIATEVKKFGGIGSIHGTIVDIDFFNHIMIDPTSNTITYYYSPMFGYVQTYGNILELLETHNPVFANKFKMLNGKSKTVLSIQNQIVLQSEMVKVDVKNSVYAFSNRLNQLQRLFDKKILRDWNQDLLFNSTAGETPSLPSK